MSIRVVPKHGKGIINRYEKGESGNPKGRPRKFVSSLKHDGYTMQEITDTIKKVLSMHEEEVEEYHVNGKFDILTKTIIHGLKRSMKKGDLSGLEILLNRGYGKYKEDVEVTHNVEKLPDSLKDVVNNDVEAALYYQKIMKKK